VPIQVARSGHLHAIESMVFSAHSKEVPSWTIWHLYGNASSTMSLAATGILTVLAGGLAPASQPMTAMRCEGNKRRKRWTDQRLL
jgi:hypothetical protein